jgi:catecholate siderophore receptor
VLGAYTLIDARIRSSNTPAEVGRFFQNTPRNSASIWATYTARRFTLGLGPRFMGRRFGNNINTRQVDGYATLDGMACGHLIPGPSRYVLLTTSFQF